MGYSFGLEICGLVPDVGLAWFSLTCRVSTANKFQSLQIGARYRRCGSEKEVLPFDQDSFWPTGGNSFGGSDSCD